MGAYLSEPLTTKDSSDESNEYLLSGSSSMQGWRVSQEDAHNCILNFDENVSFFAVYDGHGGAEVAQYCSLHLPSFLKTVEAYGQKNFEQALKDAFIGFDATLLEEKVIEVLKQLADKTNCEEEAEEDEEEEEYDNVEDLCKEAMMPLNDVLQKYRKEVKTAAPANPRVAMVAKEGNCSKPVSPFLKSKRRGAAGSAGPEGSDEADGASGSSAGPSAGAGAGSPDVPVSSGEADPAAEESKPSAKAAGDAADSTVSSSEERVKETAATAQEPSSSSSSSTSSSSSSASAPPVASGSVDATPEPATSAAAASAGGSSSKAEEEEQSNEISDTDGIVPVKTAKVEASGSLARVAKENCAPDSSSSDGSRQLLASKLNGDVKAAVASSGAVSSSCSSSSSSASSAAPAGSSAGQENGVVGSASCDSGGSSGGSKTASPATSAAKVHSSSTGGEKPESKNGPSKAVVVSMNDDDTDEDDDSDSDEEFPHADEPVDDTSSTEDGEEDPYGEEGSEEDEEVEEEGEYEEEEDFMNEEDAAFMKNITEEPGKESGCTAVVALLHGKDLYVANAGDSRCVVCRNGQALEMSFDHKPEDTIEYERIEKAGGRVTMDGRVNGGLNLSRAIGDHGYKMNKSLPPEEQMISALPDIQQITIGPEDDFMVLACDGIWNFMSSDEVVQFVLERIHKPGVKLSKICEELFDNCLAPHTKGDGTGCDNMTAIIVQFKPNFTGFASRKRTASEAVDTAVDGSGDAAAVSSATKKLKTDAAATSATASPAAADGASSTSEVETSSNGTVSSKTEAADASEATEAAAAVASIDGSSEEAASSST